MGINNAWFFADLGGNDYTVLGSGLSKVDSLVQLHSDKRGIVDVSSLLEAGRPYLYTHPELAMGIARKATSIAVAQGDPLQVANSYRSIAAALFQVAADYDSTEYYLLEAERLYDDARSRRNNDEVANGLASVYHNLGTLFQVKGDYPAAARVYGSVAFVR